MALTDPVTALKGVGPAKAQCLEKLGIRTLEDLISYFPRQYEDRTKFVAVCDLEPEQSYCFTATVVSQPRTAYIRKGLTSTRCTVADSSAQVRITWFNQPWMRDRLVPGQTYCFYGALSGDERSHQVLNPVVEDLDGPPTVTRCIIPVYPLTKGLTSKSLQQLIFKVLDQEPPADYLPENLSQDLMDLQEAYVEVHRPTTQDALAAARKRLVFEEFFLFALGLEQMKSRRSCQSFYPCPKPIPQYFYDRLDFTLTGAQQRCLGEISGDLSSGQPMNRLLQGDVGSGKTLVALGAMLQAVENGYQAVLMAPTELLAAQHYRTISEFLEPFGINCALLTGSVTGVKRRRLLDYIAVGAVKIVIGTHALFTDTTDFYNLGLVVIDEQHRFGVRQRAALAAKGSTPHMLVLSATPIPRTLALILYGDLDVSVIDERPPGRQDVETFLVSSSYRPRLLGFIRKQVQAGHQVYVVCPAVEESDDHDLTAAETMYTQLCSVFPDLRVGLVHGKLRAEAKDYAMNAFLRQETDILVATTVIEVGVDVKNATLMVIEDADRFGLSQLHQLRGRVGRNSEHSYCVLVSDNKNADTRRRLKALCDTNDGFAISQQDLDLRGPGDFFGQRQSGLPMFKNASLAQDLTVLKEAQAAASAFLASDPDPADPANVRLFARVQALFRQADDTFN
jgi:ATP-dependent DNA helicase RecG